MDALESLRRSLTEGVGDWLVRLVDSMPGTAPPRADPTAEDPAAAGVAASVRPRRRHGRSGDA